MLLNIENCFKKKQSNKRNVNLDWAKSRKPHLHRQLRNAGRAEEIAFTRKRVPNV